MNDCPSCGEHLYARDIGDVLVCLNARCNRYNHEWKLRDTDGDDEDLYNDDWDDDFEDSL